MHSYAILEVQEALEVARSVFSHFFAHYGEFHPVLGDLLLELGYVGVGVVV